jgi:CarboxypepD_reg-like domain/TonB-dependent Receptor Plug Domain
MRLPAALQLLGSPKCGLDYNSDRRVSRLALACLSRAFFVALLTIPASALARDTGVISGHVVDARTGASLPKVMVLVEGLPLSAQTDESGAFQLPKVPAGMRRLFVSVVGYILVRRDVQVLAGTTLDITIPLSEGTGTYTEAVTVAADRFRESEPAVASQQVLGSADIQNLRGVLADDPLRAVQVLPGVATGDDFRSEFSVRGSDFMHMNLTVEGFSTPYLLHTVRAVEDRSSSGSVAMINSDILEDVTLLNGGYAERYGDRTGSELDFRLREGSRERTQARVAISGTSASIVGEGPIGHSKRGSWLLTGRQSYLQLIVERMYPEGEGFNFSFSDTQAKVVFDLSSSQRAELTVLAGHSKLEEQRDDLDARDFFTGRNASVIGIGSWRLTKGRGIVTARVMSAMNQFSNDATDLVRLDKGHDKEWAGRVDGTWSLARHLQLDSGAQAEWTAETRFRQRFSNPLNRYRVINDFNDDATRSGVYAMLRATIGRATLIPGARSDRWTLTGETTTSPWVQGEVKLPHGTAVRGGAGIYQQFPEFDQVIGTLGTRDARAQRAEQYDLGVEQRLGASVRWQVTVFDREESGFFRRAGAENRLVDGRVVRGSITAPYAPSLEGFARGVEVLLQRRAINGVSGWLAYSYGRIRNTDTRTDETYWSDLDQRHAINLYVSYRLSDRTSVSAKARIGTNVPAPGYYTKEGDDYFLTTDRNTLRLPTYSRVDVRANRTFNWEHRRLTLFAEVINLLDRDNVRFNPPGVNTATRKVSNLFESMIPIVPSAGILIEF